MTDLTVTPGGRLIPAANNAVGMDGRVINLPAALIGQSGQMRLEAQVLGQDPDGLWLLQTGAGLVRLSVTDGGLERGQRLLLQLNFAGANSTGANPSGANSATEAVLAKLLNIQPAAPNSPSPAVIATTTTAQLLPNAVAGQLSLLVPKDVDKRAAFLRSLPDGLRGAVVQALSSYLQAAAVEGDGGGAGNTASGGAAVGEAGGEGSSPIVARQEAMAAYGAKGNAMVAAKALGAGGSAVSGGAGDATAARPATTPARLQTAAASAQALASANLSAPFTPTPSAPPPANSSTPSATTAAVAPASSQTAPSATPSAFSIAPTTTSTTTSAASANQFILRLPIQVLASPPSNPGLAWPMAATVVASPTQGAPSQALSPPPSPTPPSAAMPPSPATTGTMLWESTQSFAGQRLQLELPIAAPQGAIPQSTTPLNTRALSSPQAPAPQAANQATTLWLAPLQLSTMMPGTIPAAPSWASLASGQLALAKDWPVLQQLAQQLTSAGQTLPPAMTADAAPILGQLLHLYSQLRGGNVAAWLGAAETNAQAILGKNRKAGSAQPSDKQGDAELLAALDKDWQSLAEAAAPSTSHSPSNESGWRALFLPLYQDGQFNPIRFYWRQSGGGGEDESAAPARQALSTRLVIEANLSSLGALQLDGLIRSGKAAQQDVSTNGQFDLAIRSQRALDPTLREALRLGFQDAMDQASWRGQLSFVVTAQPFTLDPLPDVLKNSHVQDSL